MTIRFNADGQPLAGEFLSIKNFEMTWEFDEETFGYLGEKADHTEVIYSRVTFNGDIDVADGQAMALNDLIISREESGLPPVEFTATIMLAWRNGQAPEVRSATGLTLYMSSMSAGGRKDIMSAKIQGAARKLVRTQS